MGMTKTGKKGKSHWSNKKEEESKFL